MKGYEGWSFKEKSFTVAIGLSVIWHLAWFSLLTVSLSPERKPAKPKAKIVFLGPVLDDKIFRALVETKPELSRTVTRKLSEFTSLADIKTKTIDRYSRGSVVVLPLGDRSAAAVRGLIRGNKVTPDRQSGS